MKQMEEQGGGSEEYAYASCTDFEGDTQALPVKEDAGNGSVPSHNCVQDVYASVNKPRCSRIKLTEIPQDSEMEETEYGPVPDLPKKNF